ncbi:MAG TPA: hypothetical protein VGV35_21050 [Bryobacteraceae bacterium]|nr:hypothetical protein [Bryobacteraceae bacterium]
MESRTENTGGIIGLQRCEYDSAGRLVRLIARDKDGVDRVTESWNYDPMGRKTRTLYVDVAGQSPNTTYGWAVEGTDAIYSAPGAASLTTLYNEREQPAQILFQDIAGRMLSRVEFVYDEAGRLIEEAQTRAEEALPAELLAQMKPEQLGAVRALFGVGKPTRRLHRYDLQGRRCETRSQLPPLGSDRKTTIYNNHGDPIEEHSESESREYSIDDDGRLSDRPIQETASSSEARFEYDYDAHGNWVKKMVKGAATGQDFTIASIEERTLTYYDEVPRS